MRKTVVVLQSNYLPWKGYFDLIQDADEFVFYDDLQYTKNDWRNRNKIKTANGVQWITVPTGAGINRMICEVELQDKSWQRKHWQTIGQNYRACPHFAAYSDFFEDVFLARRWRTLSELNHYLVSQIAVQFLGVKTTFRDSREFVLEGQKQDRLLDLLLKLGATRYVSGPAAKNYIEPGRFEAAGIELVWKDYHGYPAYPQRFPPFDHGVSIVDVLFNTGNNAPWYIWGWRQKPLIS
jgi:hypothetical protein